MIKTEEEEHLSRWRRAGWLPGCAERVGGAVASPELAREPCPATWRSGFAGSPRENRPTPDHLSPPEWQLSQNLT